MPLRTGLIGLGIQASRSPALHTEEAREHGLDLSYDLLDLDEIEGGADALPRLLAEAEAAGFVGLNITHPCKQAVIPLLTRLSPDAEALGAVNTVVFRNGDRIGHNTDWSGFGESLSRGLPSATFADVVQIGAGGAGAAVAYALLKRGTRSLCVFDKDQARADALVERMRRLFKGPRIERGQDLDGAVDVCDGVVNCTPVGMAKYPGAPLPLELLAERHWVVDIIYFPIETELLKAARQRGCATLDGGGMVVFQAAEAFALFTGRSPDSERMLRRFYEAVRLGKAA